MFHAIYALNNLIRRNRFKTCDAPLFSVKIDMLIVISAWLSVGTRPVLECYGVPPWCVYLVCVLCG